MAARTIPKTVRNAIRQGIAGCLRNEIIRLVPETSDKNTWRRRHDDERLGALARRLRRRAAARRRIAVQDVRGFERRHADRRPRRAHRVDERALCGAFRFRRSAAGGRPRLRGRDSAQPDARGRVDRPADPARHHGDGPRAARRDPPAAEERGGRDGRCDRLRAVRPVEDPDADLFPLRAAAAAADRDAALARAGAPREVHVRELRRHQRGEPRDQAPGAPRRAGRFAGAAARRDRHRQGAARACDPCGVRARAPAARDRERRRDSRHAARNRVLRRGPRRVHGRRSQGARRQVRAGRSRHAVSRRDRRHAAAAAGQAAARAAGQGIRTRRLEPHRARRRADHRGDLGRPAGCGSGRGDHRRSSPRAASARISITGSMC